MTMSARANRAQTGARQRGLKPAAFFATDPAATEALLEVERFRGAVWEPACGAGDMARVLKRGVGVQQVLATDVTARGYGRRADFLTAPLPSIVNHIVTNPPYELAEEFVHRALELDPPGKIAMLLRLAWLEGIGRRDRIWKSYPPARIWIFSKRPRFARNGGDFQSGLIAFMWVVWDRQYLGAPTVGWL